MNDKDRKQNQIPDGGTWHWKQADMFEELKRDEGGFTVAWDIAAGEGKKAYGLYENAEGFYKHLLQTPHDKRFGYELIPTDTMCKGYADVEWIGEPDPHHTKLRSLIQYYRKHATEKYPEMGMGLEVDVACGTRPEKDRTKMELEVYVACGTRPEKDRTKHSYHITIVNLVYGCNHDGGMRSFFTPPDDMAEFFWRNDEDRTKCIVDLAVYTKNRVFRLPYNMKREGTVPLLRIGDDPHRDDFSFTFHDECAEDVLPMVLTQIEGSSGVYLVPKQVAVTEPVKKKKKASPAAALSKPVASPTAASSEPDAATEERKCSVDLPIPSASLKAALEAHGDTVSKPTSSVVFNQRDGEPPHWVIQCNQGGQTRQCIVDPHKSHDSNNIILFLYPEETNHTLLLKCHCTSESCKHAPHALLGEFTRGQYFQLEFVKHQPVQPVPTEDQAQAMETEAADAEVDVLDPTDTQVYSYEITKKSFERRCFRVATPFMFVVLSKDDEFTTTPQQMCYVKIRQYFGTVEYSERDRDGNTVKKRFIERWLGDKTLKEVTKLVVDPRNSDTRAYNLWRPYVASHLQAVPDAQVDDTVEPIIAHILYVIANGNEAHAEWFLDWLANMVQRPYQKSNVGILLYGKQGCGKGVIIDFMRKSVLGSHCTYQTSNPERDIFGKFSAGMVARVLVQLDEVKALHGHSDIIKDLITGDTFVYEEKYAKGITVNNYANLIFTTNNENALAVHMDDRRHVLFRCSDKYKGDVAYFDALFAHLKKSDTARAMYQFLMGRDLSKYPSDFQSSRPITEYFVESQKCSRSPMKLFMSAIVNSDLEVKVSGWEIYQRYRNFYKVNGHNEKLILSNPAFVKEFMRFDGVTKNPKTMYGASYNIDKEEVKAHLMCARDYDEDACLAPWFGKVSTESVAA